MFDFRLQEEEILSWPNEVYNVFQYFQYSHLPDRLQDVSKPFAELAASCVRRDKKNPETVVALRKLLEAKDAAVRAAL